MRNGTVTYIGSADTRIITQEQWAAINVTQQRTVTWDASNTKTVAADQFVDGALDYFKRDPEFVVELEKSKA